MKKYLIILLLGVASTQAHVWVHNKSNYYIKFVADTSVGEESIRISHGYADFVGDIQFSVAWYNKFRIYYIDANGNLRQVFSKNVSEGGNRKIVVKDNGSPDSIYIAEDILEARIPATWGHKKSAEDVGKRWL